jgi:LPS export ABC transporter protein LptC
MIRKFIRKHQKAVNNIAIVLAFVIITVLALKDPKIQEHKKKKNLPDFAFENVIITQLYDGKAVWELCSQTAQIDKKKDKAFLQNVELDLYKENKTVVHMTSEAANLSIADTDMEFSQASANFALDDREVKLKAKKLLWQAESQKFIGKEKVNIQSGAINLSGTHFFADIPVKTMVVSGKGQAIIENNL